MPSPIRISLPDSNPNIPKTNYSPQDGRIVALAGPPPGQPPGLVQTPDGRLVMAGRARAGLQDRDMMLYGAREERRDYNQAHGS